MSACTPRLCLVTCRDKQFVALCESLPTGVGLVYTVWGRGALGCLPLHWVGGVRQLGPTLIQPRLESRLQSPGLWHPGVRHWALAP